MRQSLPCQFNGAPFSDIVNCVIDRTPAIFRKRSLCFRVTGAAKSQKYRRLRLTDVVQIGAARGSGYPFRMIDSDSSVEACWRHLAWHPQLKTCSGCGWRPTVGWHAGSNPQRMSPQTCGLPNANCWKNPFNSTACFVA